MKTAGVIGFYAVVLVMVFGVRRIRLAVAALVFTLLLAVSLVIAATVSEDVGYLSAFAAMASAVACVGALRLGVGGGDDGDDIDV